MYELPKESVYTRNNDSLRVLVNKSNYYVKQNNEMIRVHNYNVDPLLKKFNKQQLQVFIKQGYINVFRFDNGSYKLTAQGRIKGGGPLLAWAGYWGTKAVCYGAALAAGSAAVVSTAGLAAGAAGTMAASGAIAAVSTSTGTAVVAGAIGASTTATAAATTATVAVVGSSGSIAAAVGAVESAATAVGALGALIPWL